MTFRTCSFEKELAQALKDGHWPEGCGPELRAHVHTCGNCSDLVLVTQTFRQARGESECAAPPVRRACSGGGRNYAVGMRLPNASSGRLRSRKRSPGSWLGWWA